MADMSGGMIVTIILGFIGMMGIPSAITAFIMSHFSKKWDYRFDKQEARREQQQKNFEQLIIFTAQNMRTTYTVAKVAAEAVKAVNPAASTNIDTAIAAADSSQAKEQAFLIHQGISSICE
jgi:hypothetical protein